MRADNGTAHIVMIEDNPSDVFLIQLAMTETGVVFHATVFQSGADALLRFCPPAGTDIEPLIPDLILLDLNTPRSDGFAVLAGIRANLCLAHVPVAIVTSSSSPLDQNRAALLGATAYIQKPSQLNVFIDRIGNGVKKLLAGSASAT